MKIQITIIKWLPDEFSLLSYPCDFVCAFGNLDKGFCINKFKGGISFGLSVIKNMWEIDIVNLTRREKLVEKHYMPYQPCDPENIAWQKVIKLW